MNFKKTIICHAFISIWCFYTKKTLLRGGKIWDRMPIDNVNFDNLLQKLDWQPTFRRIASWEICIYYLFTYKATIVSYMPLHNINVAEVFSQRKSWSINSSRLPCDLLLLGCLNKKRPAKARTGTRILCYGAHYSGANLKCSLWIWTRFTQEHMDKQPVIAHIWSTPNKT